MGKFVKVSISKSPRCDQTHRLWGPVTGNAAAPWWVCTPADPPLPLSLLLEPITTFSLRSEVEEPADGGPGAGQAGASSITLPVRRWGRRMWLPRVTGSRTHCSRKYREVAVRKMLPYIQADGDLWSCLEAESNVDIISVGKMLCNLQRNDSLLHVWGCQHTQNRNIIQNAEVWLLDFFQVTSVFF